MRRSPSLLFAAATVAVGLTGSAGAVPVPAIAPSVAAGERVVLSWGALPSFADEFEILLSVDGGGRAAIRATSSMNPSTRAIEWRVPNLPAPHARLRIRWGDGGHEIESPWSEPFEIRPARAGRLEPLHRDGAEIALGETAGPPLDVPPDAAPVPAVSSGPLTLATAVRAPFVLESPGRAGALAKMGNRPRPRRTRRASIAPSSLPPLRL